ncbi:MAG TPA: 30S ribosomal protein S6 [Solirubrobacteraceae bacterium]|nr:30S ribosomal protein S6 [Solirubrobacteraceae bacterium]
MATAPPLYDLVLLLDTQAEDERRAEILNNVQATLERGGEVIGRHDWGVRPTAYEVHKRPDADYHLFQFHGPSELLEQLDHTLKITDGVSRFRIIKLRAGTPGPPDDMAPTAAPAAAAPAEPPPPPPPEREPEPEPEPELDEE